MWQFGFWVIIGVGIYSILAAITICEVKCAKIRDDWE
jgi:hypothetical protein